jgi:hypothetical protein
MLPETCENVFIYFYIKLGTLYEFIKHLYQAEYRVVMSYSKKHFLLIIANVMNARKFAN